MMERAGEMILRFSAILLFLVNSARPQGIDCTRVSLCGSDDSFDELSDLGEPRSLITNGNDMHKSSVILSQ